MTIRVILADDHQLMREGLGQIIEDEMGMKVVAEASDGQSTVELVDKHRPDVVVMDVGMPGLNGIDATRRILRDVPNAQILALSMHNDRSYVTEMLRAGASGYVLKDSAGDELIEAIKTVSRGMTYISPPVAGNLVEKHIRHVSQDGEKSAFSVLTDREREVLQLLAEGCTTKEIAAKIYRSIKTVETHRRNIMKKLELNSVAELTKYAVRQGLTEL